MRTFGSSGTNSGTPRPERAPASQPLEPLPCDSDSVGLSFNFSRLSKLPDLNLLTGAFFTLITQTPDLNNRDNFLILLKGELHTIQS